MAKKIYILGALNGSTVTSNCASVSGALLQKGALFQQQLAINVIENFAGQFLTTRGFVSVVLGIY